MRFGLQQLKRRMRGFAFAFAAAGAASVLAAPEPACVPLQASLKIGVAPAESLEMSVNFPGEQSAVLKYAKDGWIGLGELDFDIVWPTNAPSGVRVLVYVKDWDLFWFQNELPGALVPGQRNRFQVDLSPAAAGWLPRGHEGAWHLRALMEPAEVGIRVYADRPYSGRCRLEAIRGRPRADGGPPYIRRVRANRDRVPCYDRFELAFDVPDRYPDPFDAEQVSVQAEFQAPDGKTVRRDAFYASDYYRTVENTGELLHPQGAPVWRVRFAPTQQGKYTYRLSIRDRFGEAKWGAGTFESVAPRTPGFVRVSQKDPRYFEHSDGSYYHPIGFNVRSPFDSRLDRQFPWRQRWPEGMTVYARYFKHMAASGCNIGEIWTAPWSLGLEWSPLWRGYHGVGQFNLMNAWELDRVLDEAEKNGIRLNIVVHNHGKFCTYMDPEWEFNPFNVQNGGYLSSPDEYFTDPRALKAFQKLMRYMIARWSASTSVLAWELWSEVNLTGSAHGTYMRSEVVEWHRLMGKAVKEMDPYAHPIGTHVATDYTLQNTAIISLPEIDYCPVDGYHYSSDPLQIVDLLRRTADFNNAYKKPVLITEFGGSHLAHDLDHLEKTLDAALWASPCASIAGTPMFWWWQLIEEENFYPKFAALSRFMKGEDRRDPEMTMTRARIAAGGSEGDPWAVECIRSPSRALGWIYNKTNFERIDPQGDPTGTNLVLTVRGMAAGPCTVEFWNTVEGKPAVSVRAAAENGVLTVGVPPVARDVAFKIKPAAGR
jgi:hypothetical protein